MDYVYPNSTTRGQLGPSSDNGDRTSSGPREGRADGGGTKGLERRSPADAGRKRETEESEVKLIAQ